MEDFLKILSMTIVLLFVWAVEGNILEIVVFVLLCNVIVIVGGNVLVLYGILFDKGIV